MTTSVLPQLILAAAFIAALLGAAIWAHRVGRAARGEIGLAPPSPRSRLAAKVFVAVLLVAVVWLLVT